MKLRVLVSSVMIGMAGTFLAGTQACADVVLAPLFRDHAVLQRDKLVPIWGRAEPGEMITVRFAGQEARARTAPDGRWRVDLAPLTASAEPADLTVQGSKATLTVRDVLVGEVWLASGQSNMEWPVRAATNGELEAAAAKFPAIRHFKVERTVAEAPADDVKGDWRPATRENTPHFSAVGYFFARDLHQRLRVPIGIIDSSWGGTEIEAWMSAPALATTGQTAAVTKRWAEWVAGYPAREKQHVAEVATWEAEAAAAKAAGKPFKKDRPWLAPGPGGPNTPHTLYHGMIAPLVPYALRGVLWYQGEANVGRAGAYPALMRAMIRDWRAVFGDEALPFFYVQLANWAPGGTGWVELQVAQAQVLDVPQTGMAVAFDIGQSDDIHPPNKQEVARRLALLARNRVYDMTCDDSGPVATGARLEPARGATAGGPGASSAKAGAAAGGAVVRVTFQHADGLNARGKPLSAFEVAGADGKFFAAEARLDGPSVLVRAKEVPTPRFVRYAWSSDPAANLYNGAGLPAGPFRIEVK